MMCAVHDASHAVLRVLLSAARDPCVASGIMATHEFYAFYKESGGVSGIRAQRVLRAHTVSQIIAQDLGQLQPEHYPDEANTVVIS